MVDCTKPQDNAQFKQKYSVRSFPTVIFTDSEGKEIERLQGRAPAQVLAQIQGVVQKAGPPPVFQDLGLADARAQAKSEGKLVAILFTDEAKKSAAKKNQAMIEALASKDMAELRERMLVIRRPLKEGKKTSDEAKAYRASSSPTLVILDPKVEDAKKSVLKKTASPRGLAKAVGKVLKKALGS